jgi:predicted dienelactone hydrolase
MVMISVGAVAEPTRASLNTSQQYADPSSFGPHQVGRRHLELTRGDRPVDVDIWYPATVGSEPKSVYDLVYTTLTSPNAYADAPIATGKFPIITFSHGLSTINYQSYDVMEYWASHGYIVVAPTHTGNDIKAAVSNTTVGLDQTIVDRTGDLAFSIDVALFVYPNSADATKVIATGHSMGGWAAYAQAVGFEGFGVVTKPDPRIDAVLAISPATALMSNDQLARLKKPVMVFGGSVDTLLPVIDNSSRMFNIPPSKRKFRIDVDNAGHGSPSNVCELRDALVATVPPVPPELVDSVNLSAHQACDEGIRSSAEARGALEYYGVSFFTSVFYHPTASDFPYLSRGLSQRYPVCYWRGTDALPTRGRGVPGCLASS